MSDWTEEKHKAAREEAEGFIGHGGHRIRGVSWHKRARKYQAQVKLGGKRYSAGYYGTLKEAEAAVIAKRRELYTHDDYADWATTTEAAPTQEISRLMG